MSGEHGAGVLDASAALYGGFEEVAELSGDVEDGGEEESLPERLADVDGEVAACGEEIADVDEDRCSEDAAGDGGDGALPGFAGAEARGELVLAEGSSDVESGDVSGPDADHQENHERGTVLLLPEEGNEGEGVGDPEESEEALGGVGQDLNERGAEAVPDEEGQREGTENGELACDGEVGQGDDKGQGGAEGHPPGRDAEFGAVGFCSDCCQLEVFIGGQLGDEGGEESDHPELAEEDEREDGDGEDEGGEDSFHGQMSGYRV